MLRPFVVAAVFILLHLCSKAAQVSHFTVEPVSSVQFAGTPFNLNMTARDSAGNSVSNFAGMVSFQALAAPAASSQPMLGNIGSTGASGSASVGFAVTPTNDIIVTHVRHFSGGRISIWTDDGVLLTARDVPDFGQWLETPLFLPLKMEAGRTYRVTLWSSNPRYTSIVITNFPHGFIGPNYLANADTFPTTVVPQTYLVDLRYSIGSSNEVPVSPNTSGVFTNGTWGGTLSVLEPAQNIRLFVTDGLGHSGTGNVFSVLGGNDVAVSITKTNTSIPVGDPLIYTVTITNTGPASATTVSL